MFAMKRKLSSKSGASMLLAMVFLMFCLFIGGSVLAAATANGSRVEHLKNDQQNYLSQRSAMLLMADLLTDEDGNPLNITIKEVTKPQTVDGVTTDVTTATFSCANLTTTPNPLQQMVFECIIKNAAPSSTVQNYSALKLGALTGDGAKTGTITITEPVANAGGEARTLTAKYTFSNDYDLKILFDFTPAGGAATSTESAYLTLTMDGKVNRGTPSNVTVGGVTTTTVTTSITWGAPEIQKGGT